MKKKTKMVLVLLVIVVIIVVILLLNLQTKDPLEGIYTGLYSPYEILEVSETKERKNEFVKVNTTKFYKKNKFNIYYYNIDNFHQEGDEHDIMELINYSARYSINTLYSNLYYNITQNKCTFEKNLCYDKYTFDNFVVIKCWDFFGNNDIYIGTPAEEVENYVVEKVIHIYKT